LECVKDDSFLTSSSFTSIESIENFYWMDSRLDTFKFMNTPLDMWNDIRAIKRVLRSTSKYHLHFSDLSLPKRELKICCTCNLCKFVAIFFDMPLHPC
jgi:hypothetical protein